MSHGVKKTQDVRQPTQELHEPTNDLGSSGFYLGVDPEHFRNGFFVFIQGAMMKDVVENQKNIMGDLDIDKLDDLRD